MSSFEEPTNEERAERIVPTIEAYLQARGDGNGVFDETSDPSDLLADLMHFAKRDGYDFESWLNVARINFNAEIEEDQS